MDGSKRTLFLIASLCVFLTALGVSSARLITRYAENLRDAQAVFQTLRSAASRAMEQTGPADEAWRSMARKLYAADDSVLLVALHAPGRGVLHMIPLSAPYLAGSVEDPSAAMELLYPPQTVSRLSSVIGTQSGTPVTLEILYSLLRQRDVYEAARLGLMIVSAWTALSLLVVTIMSLGRSPGGRIPAPSRDFGSGNDLPVSGFPEKESGLLDEDFDLPEIPLDPLAENRMEGTTIPEARPEVPAMSYGGRVDSAISPKGLYSPVSGLGWEEYLAERLTAELSRAASFEQDLVLLRLSHEGISRDSPSYRMMTKALLEFFSFRDMAFEQGPSGFAVILPNMDSDHALRMAEEFLKKITAQLRENGKSQDYLKVFIGLSSRSGRLVDAERLMREARAALGRAREEADSRIVAFKADPNKYRSFLASRE